MYGVQEAAGSNPVTRTKGKAPQCLKAKHCGASFVFGHHRPSTVFWSFLVGIFGLLHSPLHSQLVYYRAEILHRDVLVVAQLLGGSVADQGELVSI